MRKNLHAVPLFGTFLPGSETLTAVFARYADTANLIKFRMDVKECLVLSKFPIMLLCTQPCANIVQEAKRKNIFKLACFKEFA